MTRLILFLILSLFLQSCYNTDLMSDLIYANSEKTKVDISTIDFNALRNVKRGESCIRHFLLFPIYGSDSIVDASDKAEISKVGMYGHQTRWFFPMHDTCVIVFESNDKVFDKKLSNKMNIVKTK